MFCKRCDQPECSKIDNSGVIWRKRQKDLFFRHFSRHFLISKANPEPKQILLSTKQTFYDAENIFEKDGTIQKLLWCIINESFERDCKNNIFFYMFQVIFCALKANPRQSDFFYFQKDLKRHKKTFSRNLRPPRIFYDSSWVFLKKTTEPSFFTIFEGTFVFQRSI